VLAAILKATVALLLVGSRPFPMIFPPADAIVRTQPQPGNKMVLGPPFAHVVSGFADDRRRRHDIDRVNPSQIRTGQTKQLRAQIGFIADINPRGIAMYHFQAEVFALHLTHYLPSLFAVHLLPTALHGMVVGLVCSQR
jgi:hypothetical protein